MEYDENFLYTNRKKCGILILRMCQIVGLHKFTSQITKLLRAYCRSESDTGLKDLHAAAGLLCLFEMKGAFFIG